ncbi:PREDICTED: general transcription factor 3C polypeptide 5 isoform X2 [Tarenaya hassleriana]|uniref:general transcription factor 3C polypeptide 5 isoform X2 n=1 Tax=Tarenaya hassleriana TaxID=28532 RepID=UPI00053C9345|nr:PREDICTED: general transcription factor 3C polypeptide 5 isoform X2 [Tarenaya hassleriana]
MGVIENGTISGTLPSTEAFVVHYPGYPSSISRAVDTLGGIEGIKMARGSASNKLELRFRPEDPYAHPALGEQCSSNSFLLRISKKELTQDSRPESQTVLATTGVEPCLSEDRPALCCDIVSRVSGSYHFDGMADYQHVIPIHADIAQKKKRKWMEMESLAANSDLMDLADEDVMMLLPPFFAPKDIPENLVLRLPASSGSKKKEEVAAQNSSEIDTGPIFAIDFGVKEIPKILNWEDFIVRGSNQWQWQEAVSALFDERPIWPRESVVQRLLDKGFKCTHHMLNRFLLRAAYYFSGGPFLRFWIKRGYDPRIDPESRIYQRMEFRVPPELRGYCDANATNKLKPKWDDICAFKVFPFKCQTFLQLFELEDEYVQQEIRQPPKQTTCSYKTGWFSEATLETLRLHVSVRFVSVFPEPGFEDVFKSIQEEFERSKMIRTHKDAMKPCQEKHRETTKDDDDNEKSKSSMDEKGDDINVEEDDEDLDEPEELDLAADDDEISLDSHGYLDMENNSRTYLQGLFDSFPTVDPGFVQNYGVDDGSDGEYEIYEQESDGVCSDDDINIDDDDDDDE